MLQGEVPDCSDVPKGKYRILKTHQDIANGMDSGMDFDQSCLRV